MANDIAGTPRRLSIEGESFRFSADANLTEQFTLYENSMLATSGKAMRKMVRRVTEVTGVTLRTNSEERARLKEFAESIDDLKLSYTNIAGDTYRAVGTIEIENNETEENTTTVQLLPNLDWSLDVG